MATLKYKNPATSAWETLDALPAIGQTVEITATELTGKSTADRAAMYAAGTRLLKVVNGDTEVLLGLDADGNTEWLGSNKPLNNLLDNSDFTNPVNQRGATTYVTNNAYTIDRWILEGTTCWVTSTLISIATGSYLVQRILGNKMSNTKTYTLATMDSSGNIKVGASAGMILFDDGTYGFNTIKIAAGEYLWAALYEGAYTADTMPPHTPKGYAAELTECQRYYQAGLYLRSWAINQWDTYAEGISFRVPMRAIPTCTFKGLSSGAIGVCEMYKNGVWSNVACGTNDRDNKYISVVCANGGLEAGNPVRFLVDASADL